MVSMMEGITISDAVQILQQYMKGNTMKQTASASLMWDITTLWEWLPVTQMSADGQRTTVQVSLTAASRLWCFRPPKRLIHAVQLLYQVCHIHWLHKQKWMSFFFLFTDVIMNSSKQFIEPWMQPCLPSHLLVYCSIAQCLWGSWCHHSWQSW